MRRVTDERMRSLLKTRIHQGANLVDGGTLLEVNGVKITWRDDPDAYHAARDALMAEQAADATVVQPPQSRLEHNNSEWVIFKEMFDSMWGSLDASPRVEETRFVTTDYLLLWVLDRRAEGEDVWSVDDVWNRAIGFSTPKVWATVGLTCLRESPASAEVLEKFGPVPVELLKIIKGDPLNMLSTPEGRAWLASGEVPTETEPLPDSAPLDEAWAAESAEYKPIDDGELNIPRSIE